MESRRKEAGIVLEGNFRLPKLGVLSTRPAWPERLVIRTERTNFVSHSLRLLTSILSFALYTYSTAILAGVTMIPASDAIRCMALFAVSAGIGRLIGGRALSRHGRFKSTVVYDVKARSEAAIEQAAKTMLQAHQESTV